MPITINEMKMPNNCKECEFHQSGYPDWCDLSCRSRDVFNPSIRPDWCPLEEAVPVVRCKDCIYSKYPYRVGEWLCEYWGYAEMHEDDYCSCGKRRKQDEVD